MSRPRARPVRPAMDVPWHELAVTDVRQDLVRNIVSLRVSQDLFDDLTDDPAEAATVERLNQQMVQRALRLLHLIAGVSYFKAGVPEAVSVPSEPLTLTPVSVHTPPLNW